MDSGEVSGGRDSCDHREHNGSVVEKHGGGRTSTEVLFLLWFIVFLNDFCPTGLSVRSMPICDISCLDMLGLKSTDIPASKYAV